MPLRTRFVRMSSIALLLAILCLASGCAGGPQTPHDQILPSAGTERRCAPTTGSSRARSLIHVPIQEHNGPRAEPEASTAQRFPPEALAIAETIGALDLLVQLPTLEGEVADNREGALLRLLQVRQRLSDHILLALLDVKSAAAEADCEEERADQLADRLQEGRDQRVRRLTIFAVLGGGLVGILAGALATADPASIAGGIAAIVAGVVSSGFGTAALSDESRYVFKHERNLLREIWEGPDRPALFPETVWRYLNQPMMEDPDHHSLRETLITRWRQHGRLGEAGSATEQRRLALFFGQGGTYEIEDLRARAAMLDLLEADVNLMSQDLEQLMQEALVR
jgi:hypothetical protein